MEHDRRHFKAAKVIIIKKNCYIENNEAKHQNDLKLLKHFNWVFCLLGFDIRDAPARVWLPDNPSRTTQRI